MKDYIVPYINYLAELLERLLVLLPVSNVVCKKNTVLRILLVALTFPVINTCAELFVDDFISLYLIQIILVIAEIAIIFGLSLSDTIVLFCLQDIIIAAIQFSIAYLMNSGFQNVDTLYLGIIGNSITIVIIAIVFRLFRIGYYISILRNNRLSFDLILINMVLLFEIENILFKNYNRDYHEYRILILVCIIIVVLLNFIIISNERRVFIAQNETEFYKRDVKVMHSLIEELRSRQHQYDNRFQTIIGLPYIHKDYESLKGAIEEYSNYITDEYTDLTILQINYHLVGAFLFSKLKYSESLNKPLHITVKNPVLNTRAKEPDIVEILGIVTDNMIEASKESGRCELILDSYENRVEITTINEGPKLTPDIQLNLFKKGYSTKTNTDDNQRGYGLFILSGIVKKYGGDIYVGNDYSPDGKTTYIVFRIIL